MSYKAYLFRMRTSEDVEDVRKLISPKSKVPAYLDFIYQPDKAVSLVNREIRRFRTTFETTDLIAALTVDRGDLARTFREEVGVDFKDREPFWIRLDHLNGLGEPKLERSDTGCQITGWKIPTWSSKNWVKKAKKHLSILDKTI
jgi:hypothetical protein